MKQLKLSLWAVILSKFAEQEWTILISDFQGKRGWRSFSQAFSHLRNVGVKIIHDMVECDGEMISRWRIPEEGRPHAIRLLNSKQAGEKIPYANLEPPPTQKTLFDIGKMKADAKLNAQYNLHERRS